MQYGFWTYIRASNSGTLYVGITNDLESRVYQHKNELIEGFAKKYRCHRLVYFEEFADVRQAIAFGSPSPLPQSGIGSGLRSG